MVTSGLVLKQESTLIGPQKLGNGDLWIGPKCPFKAQYKLLQAIFALVIMQSSIELGASS